MIIYRVYDIATVLPSATSRAGELTQLLRGSVSALEIAEAKRVIKGIFDAVRKLSHSEFKSFAGALSVSSSFLNYRSDQKTALASLSVEKARLRMELIEEDLYAELNFFFFDGSPE